MTFSGSAPNRFHAIPLELLKSEQTAIAKSLAVIDHEIKIHNTAFDELYASLTLALDLIENCGQTYREASDTTKRLLNQAIFKGFYIYNGGEITAELAEPYNHILPAIKDDIANVNHHQGGLPVRTEFYGLYWLGGNPAKP